MKATAHKPSHLYGSANNTTIRTNYESLRIAKYKSVTTQLLVLYQTKVYLCDTAKCFDLKWGHDGRNKYSVDTHIIDFRH
jgi:hypothetical protein